MIPLVWLAGASGTGKSTAGYGAFRLLRDAGTAVAYVDADQLRLATGVAVSEDALIAAALNALAPRYAASGARALIVSGIADDLPHLARLTGDRQVTPILLQASADAVRERVAARGWGEEQIAAAVAGVPSDGSFGGTTIDTSAEGPREVAERVASVVESVAVPEAPRVKLAPPDSPPGRVLLVTGPGGVGLSTMGWLTYLELARSGHAAAYADAFQLSFCPEPERRDPELVAAHAGVLAANGVETLVITGGLVAVAALAQRMADAPVAFLSASPETLGERIRERSNGVGPGIPGDHRVGVSGAELDAAIAASVAQLGEAPAGARVIDTDGLSPAAVAEGLARLL